MGSCYKVYSFLATWGQAVDKCLNVNSKLVDIKNHDENSFLENLLSTASISEAWIGLSDILEDGVFRWRDDTYANFTKWGTNEPNGGTTENCTSISVAYSWRDRGCSTSIHFICEKTGW